MYKYMYTCENKYLPSLIQVEQPNLKDKEKNPFTLVGVRVLILIPVMSEPTRSQKKFVIKPILFSKTKKY